MINIGINGFGRIGKCCFLQMLDDINIHVCCINVVDMSIDDIEDYLRYDSVHHNYNKLFPFEIVSSNKIKINNNIISIVSDRNAKNIKWKKYDCEYVIDATGAYLTLDKCKQHDVNHVIISAPAKDNTPTYVYGVNDEKYNGEKIISGASCTTNCLAPMLKILNDKYKVEECVFTTIHALTSSQNIADVGKSNSRICRSGLSSMIPHTTGASSAILKVLPKLKNIHGTSVRVPTTDVSLLDVNIELKNKDVKLKDIEDLLKHNKLYGEVYDVTHKKLISSDFLTTTTPTILDINASLDMGNGKFKLILWYDNEWSYSSQLIRMIKTIDKHNSNIKSKYYVKNLNLNEKSVLCRFDFNVPYVNGKITDEYRITTALPTIKYVLSQNPKCLILSSHFGRPTEKNEHDSLEKIVPILEKYLKRKVIFLEDGVDMNTYQVINNTNPGEIYLLENLRFHAEETKYDKMTDKEILENNTIKLYNSLADVYINDAFGCCHRNNMSICSINKFDKVCGFGLLIKKELKILNNIVNSKKNKLGIFGGNKISDKLPIMNILKNKKNTNIFVGGGLASQYNGNDNNVVKMTDGYGNNNLTDEPIYISDISKSELNIYDIGYNSLNVLYNMIEEADVLFWNGTMGVIEHDIYVKGSLNLLNHLANIKNKLIIIGGGETASLVTKNLITHTMQVSTGGGAMLEYLQKREEGKNLIGLCIFI